MAGTRVVNMHRERADVMCDRTSSFGNRHRHGACPCGKEHTRDEAIALFEQEFLARVETDRPFREQVLRLEGKALGCHCLPKRCHVSVIAEWIERTVSR